MRPHFEELFRKHSYNVRPGSFFNVGMGWQHMIQQVSAALLGFTSKVWIIGADKEAGELVLKIDFEGEPDPETAEGVRGLLQRVREQSLSICEVCGKPGSITGPNSVRCEEHADLTSLDEVAELLQFYKPTLWHIIEVGDVVPALTILHDGSVFHDEAEFGFTSADIVRFQEERDRRQFKHIHEQFGYAVAPDAKFACGPGWETVLRRLADGLGQLHGPKLVGGKEKFGSFQSEVWPFDTEYRGKVEELTKAARKLSLTICDECGAPGRLRMGIRIAKTTCDRHAFLVGELREEDGWIVDLPPTGGPIYADGQQVPYGIDHPRPKAEGA